MKSEDADEEKLKIYFLINNISTELSYFHPDCILVTTSNETTSPPTYLYQYISDDEGCQVNKRLTLSLELGRFMKFIKLLRSYSYYQYNVVLN